MQPLMACRCLLPRLQAPHSCSQRTCRTTYLHTWCGHLAFACCLLEQVTVGSFCHPAAVSLGPASVAGRTLAGCRLWLAPTISLSLFSLTLVALLSLPACRAMSTASARTRTCTWWETSGHAPPTSVSGRCLPLHALAVARMASEGRARFRERATAGESINALRGLVTGASARLLGWWPTITSAPFQLCCSPACRGGRHPRRGAAPAHRHGARAWAEQQCLLPMPAMWAT